MNISVITGCLVRDAQISSAQGGDMRIAKFTVAVNRMKKDEADFISCVAFGKTVDIIEKYTTKGSKVGIIGHIQTGSYTNKDGAKVYTTDVIVDRLELMGSKAESKSAETKPDPIGDDFMKIDDSLADTGLPFM